MTRDVHRIQHHIQFSMTLRTARGGSGNTVTLPECDRPGILAKQHTCGPFPFLDDTFFLAASYSTENCQGYPEFISYEQSKYMGIFLKCKSGIICKNNAFSKKSSAIGCYHAGFDPHSFVNVRQNKTIHH